LCRRNDDCPIANKEFHVIREASFLNERLWKPNASRIPDPDQASFHGEILLPVTTM
jgi:hypothetical protein